ncbi:carbamoyl-phosphate synthase large subunit [Tumebacillus sp. BK434]|uniref:carbamoyl-phosphate synthase large subunit n=1 Tax=Tumebacillus sp. BK434 TaxID=2512169 RepID=UPI00104F411B|nr:carbamoyl-phosphate synthase large subunit [Tumebacillus sp. BK434]TCP55929.1 carbamoyl-phosphate synthase large subunit [Tumebacillus sp. BK434]
MSAAAPNLAKILVIGSGPIVIGQAAEFDYAGTQACKALREEGCEVILVNSNPATIMTDHEVADRIYIEPLTVPTLTAIIAQERPQGLLATLGGQTALNLAVDLAEAGVLAEYDVQLLGTPLASIQRAEDRQLFKDLMEELEQPIPESAIVHTLAEGRAFLQEIGLPVILRPAFTLGGTGGGIAETLEEFEDILLRGLKQSPISQVLVERSIKGWKEIEYEVMRDSNDTCITICNMENLDPVGVHTGDSIVVAPSQTLTDREYQMLRTASLKIIRGLKIEGGCNVQFALDPHAERYCVIEVNPRVSRSSALASKATGYPIAKIAAKIAIGQHLHEIVNPVTGKTFASFEPALDYIVVKVPRWPFDKFPLADRTLGTQMKATGEVMALGRTFEEALQKAVRSLEIGADGLTWKGALAAPDVADDRRLFALMEALRGGAAWQELQAATAVDAWFLQKLQGLVDVEREIAQAELSAELLTRCKQRGFSDARIAQLNGIAADEVTALRKRWGISPAYQLVDTCAAEFVSATPYFYSTYHGEDEYLSPTNKQKALVLGSGPIRIGQGIEFDYCSVHAVKALEKLGFETVILNNNPETVSTDFDTADRLFFEPLTAEDVLEVAAREGIDRVFVQFGGQTAINLAEPLQRHGLTLAGTTLAAIHRAEDREEFRQLLDGLGIPQTQGSSAYTVAEALQAASAIGYPVMVRPSYVIGGRGMAIVHDEQELVRYMEQAMGIATAHPSESSQSNGEAGADAESNRTSAFGHPILIDQYLTGQEVEVDAICDGEHVLIPGIFEHIERAGVHSGDSLAVYPPQSLSEAVTATLVAYTQNIAKALGIIGLLNIQFVLANDSVYVLEANPRASRTVPILSKVTGVPMVELAVRAQCGERLADCGYGIGLYPAKDHVVVKAPVFSFGKLTGLDIQLGPEMKSTGEALGIGQTYPEALAKAFLGSGLSLPADGGVLLSITDRLKAESLPLLRQLAGHGMTLYATAGTAAFLETSGLAAHPVSRDEDEVLTLLKSGKISLVLNLPTQGNDPARLGCLIRRFTVEMKIPCLTALDTAAAWLLSLEAGTGVTPYAIDSQGGISHGDHSAAHPACS